MSQILNMVIYYKVEWFHLHNLAVCCILSTLVKLP